jgi:hypothetical protein
LPAYTENHFEYKGYGKVAPAPVRSTDPPDEADEADEAVEEAVPELFAPSLAHATANNMRAASFKALTERLLFFVF